MRLGSPVFDFASACSATCAASRQSKSAFERHLYAENKTKYVPHRMSMNQWQTILYEEKELVALVQNLPSTSEQYYGKWDTTHKVQLIELMSIDQLTWSSDSKEDKFSQDTTVNALPGQLWLCCWLVGWDGVGLLSFVTCTGHHWHRRTDREYDLKLSNIFQPKRFF